jgi:small subunit ribosomal protein S7
MVKRYRDLTEKYRAFRLQPDAVYQSRLIQTLLNKFIKKGKKASSQKNIMRALTNFRFLLRRPRTHNALIRILRSLRIQFILLAKRQGKNILEVPVPVRRNKRDIMNIQTFYNAVLRRRERSLAERLEQELLALSLYQPQSTTLRQRNLSMAKVYEERVNMEKRWK